MTPCVVLVDQRFFVLRRQFDCGAASLLYIYVSDFHGSCCVLGLRHFACDIPLKLNGILGQSHLYSLWSWQWGCFSWIYAWSGFQFYCPSCLVGQGRRGWPKCIRYAWHDCGICNVYGLPGGGVWVSEACEFLFQGFCHTCVLVCPVQAHSKLNAEIGNRSFCLMKCACCPWTSILLESCVLRCFFGSFPHTPVLAALCRIPVTFVLLPETCRAAQLEYLVSLSAWIKGSCQAY